MVDTANGSISKFAHVSLLEAGAYDGCKLGHNDIITHDKPWINHAPSDSMHECISQLQNLHVTDNIEA